MIPCKECGFENPSEALFCNQCGTSLFEKEIRSSDNKKTNKTKIKKKKKVKKKTKTKYKTKTEKEVEHKMGFFSKLFMFLLILVVLISGAVILVLGYHIYKSEVVEVPNVVNTTYEEASMILLDRNLKVERKDQIVADESQVGIVLSQNKKVGQKVREKTTIKLTVGVLDLNYQIPNLIGKLEKEAINILNEDQIRYKVVYEESSEEEGTVLDISPSVNTKIKKTDLVVLTVSKKKEVAEPTKTPEETSDPDDSSEAVE